MLDAVASARRASPSAAARLRLVFTTHLRTLLDDIEGATAHLQIESLPPALRTAIVRKRDRYEHALRRVIADGVRAGELVDMNPAIVARAMLGAMNWTVTWFRPEGAQPPERVAQLVADYAVAGLSGRRPGVVDPARKGARATRPHHADRERRHDRSRLRAIQNAAGSPT